MSGAKGNWTKGNHAAFKVKEILTCLFSWQKLIKNKAKKQICLKSVWP
uniref:Uncharacterized protein n=1 Tax=Anguilla anguilla TaxID=7936 RepID=A0A0E9R4C2_ANGAN